MAGYAGGSRPTPPPLFSRPARTPLPPWGGGRQRTPPSREAPADRYPFLSGRKKSPHRRYFFVKVLAIIRTPLPGSHFWGGGFPVNPPARYFSGRADPPPSMVGGVGREPPLRSRSCRLERGRGYSRERITTPEDAKSGGGIFCKKGEGGWAGTPLAALGPGGALGSRFWGDATPFAEIRGPPARSHCNASGYSLYYSRRRTVHRSGSIPRFLHFVPARFAVFRKSGTAGRYTSAVVPVFPQGISGGKPGTLRQRKGVPSSSRIIPGMAGGPGHHDAVRELRPVPWARLLFAGERRELDILIAGIFSEAPQVRVNGFCRIHAGELGQVGSLPLPPQS